MHCAQCGRLLAAHQDICPVCDQELSTVGSGGLFERERVHRDGPGQAPDAGPYQCPQCHLHFDQWNTAPYPPQARWWQPQSLLPACPHCQTPLLWQRLPALSLGQQRLRFAALLAAGTLLIALQLYGKGLIPQPALLLLILGSYALTYLLGQRSSLALNVPVPEKDAATAGEWQRASIVTARRRQLFGMPPALAVMLAVLAMIAQMWLLPQSLAPLWTVLLAATTLLLTALSLQRQR